MGNHEGTVLWMATHLESGNVFIIRCDEAGCVSELSMLNAHIRRTRRAGPWRIEGPDGIFVYPGLSEEALARSSSEQSRPQPSSAA